MSSKQSDRRRFLKESAALAGLAVGAIPILNAQSPAPATKERRPDEWYDYGVRSRFVKSMRIGTNGRYGKDPRPGTPRDYGFRAPLQDTFGIITPAPLHFIINHGYDPPDIDPREHRLMIHGLVDRPLVFTMDELMRLPSVSRIHFLECAGNATAGGQGFMPGYVRTQPEATVQQIFGLTSCSEWTGVQLSLLLQEAGLKKEGKWIVAEGDEQGRHTKSIPIEKALDDVLVVYAQNGEPIRPEQGYPLRLLVPGWEGINNVKWLRRIKVMDKPSMGKREITAYTNLRVDGKARWFQFELGPKSVITRPSGQQRLPGPGFYELTGLAWSGGGTIRRVEISTDNGRTWKDAQLQEPIHRKAHTRFRLPWNWNGEESVLLSRCTDDQGWVQPSVAELGKVLGVEISLAFFRERPDTITHFNAIQPWRVKRDGSVENAIFA
jgi:sulfane dehydrogenase subunit SoxC